MAAFNLESLINTLPDTSVLPCFQGHPVVQSKLLDFSAFKSLGSKEVYEALSSFRQAATDTNNLFYANLAKERLAQIE